MTLPDWPPEAQPEGCPRDPESAAPRYTDSSQPHVVKKRALIRREARSLLAKLSAQGWKRDAERDELLAGLDAIRARGRGRRPGWPRTPTPPSAGRASTILQRFPFERRGRRSSPSSPAARSRCAARRCRRSRRSPAPSSRKRWWRWLEHPDPAVVHAALDYASRTLRARVCRGVCPGARRDLAVGAAEGVRDRRGLAARRGRRRSRPRRSRMTTRSCVTARSQLLARNPGRGRHRRAPEALPQRVAARAGGGRHGAHAAPDAAGRAVSTTRSCRFSPTPTRRSASSPSRILQAQPPETVADAFLQTFRGAFGQRPRPEHPGDRRARTDLRPGAPRAGPQPRSRDRCARRRRSPSTIRVRRKSCRTASGTSTATTSGCASGRRSVLAELKDQRGAAAAPEAARPPGVEPLGRQRARRLGQRPRCCRDCSRPTRRAPTDLRLEILDAFGQDPRPARAGRCSNRSSRRIPSLRQGEGRAPRPQRVPASPTPSARPRRGAESSRPWTSRRQADPDLADLLRHARAVGASDLHVAAGTMPHLRDPRRASAAAAARDHDRGADGVLDHADPGAGAPSSSTRPGSSTSATRTPSSGDSARTSSSSARAPTPSSASFPTRSRRSSTSTCPRASGS